jgi:two-component system sensor histidine kinase KdpD
VTDSRPNPDQLLASIQRDEAKARRGRLKIFFGMSPGVGKTYAMLQGGRRRQKEGVEVVIGVVETHGRVDTEALVEGLPIVPRTQTEHRGATLGEMDLEAILLWRPQLVLVDELAHTNAPGSRHRKRYQDVLELLDAGIDVHTTINVQHIESRQDTVQQITGVAVRETVPDSVLDLAEEIELVDLTPRQLRERLAEGKVYLGERAAAAADHFFKESNLTALREMALRLTAEHVDRDLRAIMHRQQVGEPWKVGDRLLVAVSSSPHSEKLIRWTRRLAGTMEAPWLAAYVETPRTLSAEDSARLSRNLSLARKLGAEVITAAGTDFATTLLDLARQHHVTQLIVGKPPARNWRTWFGRTPVDLLIEQSGEIDIQLVRLEGKPPGPPPLARPSWRDCSRALLLAALVTGAGLLLEHAAGYRAIGVFFLLAVVVAAQYLGRAATLMFGAFSAFVWNFIFIPPRFTFAISEPHDFVMFGAHIIVALVVGQLTAKLREREQGERKREARATALYRLTQRLSAAVDLPAVAAAVSEEIRGLFGAPSAILLRDAAGIFTGAAQPGGGFTLSAKEESVAAWSFQNRQPAGRFTDTLPESEALFLPVFSGEQAEGVLVLRPESAPDPLPLELLGTIATQLAAFVQRERALRAQRDAQLAQQSEKLQRTLFDSVSHELKTPLAVLAGELERPEPELAELRRAASRLRRTVEHLLDATRLESGLLQPSLEWCEAAELLDEARTRAGLSPEALFIDVAPDLPPFRADGGLLAQSLATLFGNASSHGASHEPTVCKVRRDGGEMVFEITDRGPGVPPGDEEKIFERFTRGREAAPGGLGLGLSIARRLVEAHGGTLVAENRPAGGARFLLRLPIGGEFKMPT